MSEAIRAAEPSSKYIVQREAPLIRGLQLLSSALGGVTKLRELIQSLAVRGLLVPQTDGDEPASDLLARICAERVRLFSAGQISKGKPVSALSDDDIPAALPYSWTWVRFGALVDASDAGWSPNCEGSRRTGVSWGVLKVSAVSWGEFRSQENKELPKHLKARAEFEVRDGDFLMSRANTAELVARSVVVSNPEPHLMMSDKIIRLRLSSLANRQFFNVVNNSRIARRYYVANASGTSSSMKNVGREVILGMPIPLPPLAEQHRIVTRVEELMTLCDALEQSGRLADAQHARLTSTLFDALAASESAHALAENWQRIAEHFDLLLDRHEAIDALELAILRLAVRGLLVPQDSRDEPASGLLCRLESKRVESTDPGAVRKEATQSASYDLPDSWAWAPLGFLVENMSSGWSPACDEGERSDSERWAVLRTTAVQVMEFRSREHKAIPTKLVGRPGIEVHPGDILITRAGPMNRVGISCWVDQSPPRLMLSDKIVRFHPTGEEMDPAFIVLALNAGWTKDQLEAAKSGMAASQVNISQTDLRGIFLPVCSKAEQHRIVARVEELRRLCAQLRERLTEARRTQTQLAEALVATVG